MTSHTNHDHPNTTAARTQCRKDMANATVSLICVLPPKPVVVKRPKAPKLRFNQTAHCSSCGSTDAEEVDPWDAEREGYTGCCNKRISYTCRTDNCFHA